MKRRHGINFWNDGTVEVMLWAPLAETVEVQIAGNKKFSLSRQDIGCWSITTRDIKPGDLYKFILNSEKEIPDPASMSQPEGVHGVSKAIDPAQFKWSDTDWRNIPWEEYIIYELHIGTFS